MRVKEELSLLENPLAKGGPPKGDPKDPKRGGKVQEIESEKPNVSARDLFFYFLAVKGEEVRKMFQLV